ncbi:phosphoglycerate dehydrogenase [Leuconostoc falkenbergense]|uniref:phosphoglycerate dehydrogenase n=1 Tax=Leuconostoc falkenbergense TaxID=2766470 RepID=UPI0039EBD3E8
MKKVLVASQADEIAKTFLIQQGFQVLENNQETDNCFDENPEVEAVLLMPIKFDDNTMNKMPNLKIIARHGVGYDNVSLSAATQRGIVVTNTPGANASSVAETALMFLLMSGRQFASKLINSNTKSLALSTGNSFGYELSHKIVGIIGYGNIGRKIARLLSGFNVKILVNARHKYVIDNGEMASLAEIYEKADYIVLALPATPETTHMINAATLKLMKKNAVLINVGRGQLIDEDALYSALISNQIFGAGLDVTENEPVSAQNPLYSLPNVFLTPHVAGQSREAKENVALEAAKEITRVLNGSQPKHQVNN